MIKEAGGGEKAPRKLHSESRAASLSLHSCHSYSAQQSSSWRLWDRNDRDAIPGKVGKGEKCSGDSVTCSI